MRLPLIALLLALPLAVRPAGPFAFREAGPGSLELTENGKPVYVFHHGMQWKQGAPEAMRRCCYLHPLYAPDGTAVTDDFPKDHYHHRGVFWAWPVVSAGGETYDLWVLNGVGHRFVKWLSQEANGGFARLAAENGWFAGERKLVKETIEIVSRPARSNRRELDFTLSLEALGQPVQIAGQQDGKGYGGFCIRFGDREDTVVRTDTGREAKDTNLVPHPWAELEGKFGGRRAGARIDIDQANPGFPNGWCLRYYGFLGVNFPGLKPYTLEPGKPVILKYRVTVYTVP
ncbi:MAG TPA: DUF6807 family protein [Bryobacteraceae bacterium]|nr:DUF6807 family protein [Bryobacteraceae bacterium]